MALTIGRVGCPEVRACSTAEVRFGVLGRGQDVADGALLCLEACQHLLDRHGQLGVEAVVNLRRGVMKVGLVAQFAAHEVGQDWHDLCPSVKDGVCAGQADTGQFVNCSGYIDAVWCSEAVSFAQCFGVDGQGGGGDGGGEG
ncbi:hypothetical protein Rhe02_33550 [Rhizocola hellebori]|uniref:Uncharacterized protein n=1 Tax=Rhizocola hellebori TaxID=1392758 RepID=A0A8J3Q8R6_9ACTN|nr:hypothetical protein [Rhizocola hellebori]GIH05288.1 hypothetical protein Rhe02_33550 [Rhizocola hellebori]